jgi:ribose transport system ATP-binding protein
MPKPAAAAGLFEPPHDAAAPLPVAFEGVSKSFGPVEVLHDVSFALTAGAVTGLLGENGAGKSTLMKILSGLLAPSAGRVMVSGSPHTFRNAREAEAAGIVLIHQELALAEDLTIAQNLFLGREIKRGWLLDDRAMAERARAALAEVGYHGDPGVRVRNLINAEKQLVEIAKARTHKARVLILDEPTASLTPAEAERLFALIARLKAEGATIVYISHKLEEIERITDEIVVMRDGRFVARARTAEVSRARMAELMIGRELSDFYPEKRTASRDAPVLLKLEGARVPGWADDVSFEVRAGEILGIGGLVGSGRTELFEGLIGLRPFSARRVEIGGRSVAIGSPKEAALSGLGYLSEDRKGRALHVDFPVRANITLAALKRHARPLLSRASERAAAEAAIAALGIKTSGAEVLASALSGGNQQKVAIAKFLQPAPKIFVLDEPTRGVDIGAKREIYRVIARLAAEGRAIIVISSELVELIGLTHRVVVMRRGRLVADVPIELLTEQELLSHAIGDLA